jgi:hypothetical protein
LSGKPDALEGMMRKLIEVTKDDIKRGVPYGLCNCPVALATKRAFPGYCVDAMRPQIEVFRSGHLLCFPTPKRVCTFMERFDNKKSVKPFRFYLTV